MSFAPQVLPSEREGGYVVKRAEGRTPDLGRLLPCSQSALRNWVESLGSLFGLSGDDQTIDGDGRRLRGRMASTSSRAKRSAERAPPATEFMRCGARIGPVGRESWPSGDHRGRRRSGAWGDRAQDRIQRIGDCPVPRVIHRVSQLLAERPRWLPRSRPSGRMPRPPCLRIVPQHAPSSGCARGRTGGGHIAVSVHVRCPCRGRSVAAVGNGMATVPGCRPRGFATLRGACLFDLLGSTSRTGARGGLVQSDPSRRDVPPAPPATLREPATPLRRLGRPDASCLSVPGVPVLPGLGPDSREGSNSRRAQESSSASR